NRILNDEVNLKKKPFPRSEKEFSEMLAKNGLAVSSILDGYGRPVYLSAFVQPRYGDKTKVVNAKTEITPVAEELMVIKVRSRGEDGFENSNDFDLATFSSVITENSKGLGFSRSEVHSTAFSGAKGAIKGIVLDANGAVIPGAKISAVSENASSEEFSSVSDDNGSFIIANLPSGIYRVVATATAFKSVIVNNINIRSQTLIEITISLQVGGVSETVDVSSGSAETVNTTNSSISSSVTKTNARIQFPYKEQTSTPRLREYFPESLLWKPEVITDSKGKATVDFKMADNITTWKMFAVASTKKGKIGVVEKEITAFQPFFADLDPPRFLTDGDEIFLPTQIRNYTDKRQKVDVSMDRSDWFSFLGASRKQIEVDAGQSQNAVFGFRAVMPVRDGKQRVTATAQKEGDAIEKSVTVRPNGREVVHTESRLFTGSGNFAVNFPANALPRSQKTELKIYPNLYSHVAESVEGLLVRPYGCGEQTISSTYPNLMILKFAKADSAIAIRARKYLQKGYERLLGYQVADGGFSYWGGRDQSDLALTAYALRFLNDARSFLDVDDAAVEKAQKWLAGRQNADGSWSKINRWETSANPNATKLVTSYVARSLAMAKGASDQSLTRALTYLKNRNDEIDEPYAMALFGLAALDAGDQKTAAAIAERLEKMALSENDSVYWKLETNTPFNGWGTAGRIETTALVLQLLTRNGDKSPTRDSLIERATLFLLKSKDRYGVWYSTQTTINVLDGFIAAIKNGPNTGQAIDIKVNGAALSQIGVEADRIEPIIIDIGAHLAPTANAIEIKSNAASPLMAQVVAMHYIDWKGAAVTGANADRSRAVRLDYKCDKTEAAVMEMVQCSVSTERVGFQGYGMLLAELGTPPGADVSRESLEKALEGDWSVSWYEVLPDRVIVYMWARAGGTKFSFNFRPRYGINAQTPASIVYDYYNPEAQAVVAPLRFSLK
ncbi:MAG: alpha-2-macroglobulin family protein, partial [Pyrinomonadaceae bacterium]